MLSLRDKIKANPTAARASGSAGNVIPKQEGFNFYALFLTAGARKEFSTFCFVVPIGLAGVPPSGKLKDDKSGEQVLVQEHATQDGTIIAVNMERRKQMRGYKGPNFFDRIAQPRIIVEGDRINLSVDNAAIDAITPTGTATPSFFLCKLLNVTVNGNFINCNKVVPMSLDTLSATDAIRAAFSPRISMLPPLIPLIRNVPGLSAPFTKELGKEEAKQSAYMSIYHFHINEDWTQRIEGPVLPVKTTFKYPGNFDGITRDVIPIGEPVFYTTKGREESKDANGKLLEKAQPPEVCLTFDLGVSQRRGPTMPEEIFKIDRLSPYSDSVFNAPSLYPAEYEGILRHNAIPAHYLAAVDMKKTLSQSSNTDIASARGEFVDGIFGMSGKALYHETEAYTVTYGIPVPRSFVEHRYGDSKKDSDPFVQSNRAWVLGPIERMFPRKALTPPFSTPDGDFVALDSRKIKIGPADKYDFFALLTYAPPEKQRKTIAEIKAMTPEEGGKYLTSLCREDDEILDTELADLGKDKEDERFHLRYLLPTADGKPSTTRIPRFLLFQIKKSAREERYGGTAGRPVEMDMSQFFQPLSSPVPASMPLDAAEFRIHRLRRDLGLPALPALAAAPPAAAPPAQNGHGIKREHDAAPLGDQPATKRQRTDDNEEEEDYEPNDDEKELMDDMDSEALL
jgi:hypothetical protein